MTLEPQVVARGEGVSDYRARKPPEAVLAHLCGFREGILILRCHDAATGVEAVTAAVDAGEIPRDLVERLGAFGGTALHPIWVRYVPDDYDHPDAGGSYERELRGTVGATPALLCAQINPAQLDAAKAFLDPSRDHATEGTAP